MLARVTPDRVDGLLAADPSALRALTRSLAARRQAQTPALKGPSGLPRVVTILGIGDVAPAHWAADELGRGLVKRLSMLTSRSLAPQQLHRAEGRQDRVLLVADDPQEPWHAFCQHRADRVMVVAARSSVPPPVLSGVKGMVMVSRDTRGVGLLEFHQIDRARVAGRVAGAAVAAALAEQIRPAVPQPRDADQNLGAAQPAPGPPPGT